MGGGHPPSAVKFNVNNVGENFERVTGTRSWGSNGVDKKAAEQQFERGGEGLSNIHREPGPQQSTMFPLFLFLARLVASELQQQRGLREVDGICHDRKRDH